MKTKKLLVLLLSLSLIFSALAIVISASITENSNKGSEKINVWLMAGQSNAVGYGEVDGYSGADGELLDRGVANVLYYGAGYGSDSESFVPVRFGLGKSAKYSGAELGIAAALANSGEKHAIIKYADGDTQLSALNVNAETNVSTWTPPSYIEAHPEIEFEGDKIGDLYNGLIATVTDGIAKLEAEGYTPVIQGIWWMQGERDGNHGSMTGELYAELLKCLISDLRLDVGEAVGADCSEVPFVYGRVYRNPAYAPNSEAGLAGVLAGQDAVAADGTLTNVAMLDTRSELIDFYTRGQVDLVQHDGWHYDSYTQQLMGEALVRKVNAMKPTYTDTTDVSILASEQALYTATLNYVMGAPVSLKLGSTQLFTLSDTGINILSTNIKGTYAPGDYTVYVCVNPAQNMTIVEVKLPDGGILRRGTYGKHSGTNIVASANDEARIKNVNISYERLTLNKYEIVSVEPTAEGFGANVYNLMNSFSDATSSRLFAWTAKADFIGERAMAIKYRAKGASEWTVADAYKLDEPTPYSPEDYFKVEIYSLSANTEYEYKIGVKESADEENEWSKSYFFTTANGDEKEFTFIAIGDTQGITWGGTETANKGFMYTKAALDEAFEEVGNPAFILHTGDVVEEGLKEEQWNYYFKALGEAGAAVPHFATPGNHDDNLTSADQNFYFGMHLNHPDNGGNAYLDPVVVNVINSLDPETVKDATWVQLVIKYMDETFYSYDYGDAHFIVYNSGAYSSQDELILKAQRAWLKADLEANKDAKWTVLLAHQANYHLYGGGYSRNNLTDIIEGFDVDLVIQGHSHLVARSYPMKNGEIVRKDNLEVINKGEGTVYMLIGATALNHDPINYNGYTNEENQAVAISNVGTQPSYAVFNVSETSIEVTVKQVNGLVLDKFSIVEPEEEKTESEDITYTDNFKYFTYSDLTALGIWETENSGKYSAKAPSYSAQRLKLSDKQSVQFNWLKYIGGIENYDPNDTYVFEFDANVTSWGTNSASSTRTLYVAPGGYYNQVGLHHSDTTMQVGEETDLAYTYDGEETFRIRIEWRGKTITSTVTDSKGKTITGSRTKDNYVNVATDPLLQTMVFRCEDGEVYIDNFVFRSFSDVLIDGYGTLPSNYADAERYPIVLFQNGVFHSAYGYDQFKEATAAARGLVPSYDGAQENAPAAAKILLRADAAATGNDQNIGQAVGEIDINLGGFTLTHSGGSHLFYLRMKTYSSHAQKLILNVYNGNIELSGFLFGVGGQQNNSSKAETYTILKDADINFKDVNISLVRGKGWDTDPIFQDQTGTNYSADKQVDFKAVFEDCVFDYSRMTANNIFFSLNHASSTVNAIDLTLRGGEIKLSTAAANTKLYELNDVSSVTFEKGADDKYTKITVPTGVSADVTVNNNITVGAEKASFIKSSEDALTATYTLEGTGDVQGIYIEDYGILPKEYSDASTYPIVLFQGGVFKQAFAADQFAEATNAARVLVDYDKTNPAKAQILLRGNASATSYGDQNLARGIGEVDINLNGYTLNQTYSNYLFLLRIKDYNANHQKFTLTIRDGKILLNYVMFGLSAQSSVANSELNDADINVTNVDIVLQGQTPNAGPIFGIAQGGNGNSSGDTDMVYNANFTDCTFDFSNMNKANYIFNLNHTTDKSVVIELNLKLNGGEVIVGKGNGDGTRPYASSLYALNSVSSVSFGKGCDGKYLKITVPSDVTAYIHNNLNYQYAQFRTEFYTDGPITKPGTEFVTDGTWAEFVNPVTEGSRITYTLQPEVYIDGYGTVTPAYSNASLYPILVFQGGVFKSGFKADQFKEALTAARGLVPSHTGVQDNSLPEAQILLLADAVSLAREENVGQAVGVIDINLNGYTLTQAHDGALFWLRTKTYSNYDQKMTFKVRNGSISLRSYLFAIGTQNNSGSSHMSGNFKNGEIVFDGVDIELQRGVSLVDSLILVSNGSIGGSTADTTVEYKIDFNDCVFDLSGVTENTVMLNFEKSGISVKPAVSLGVNGGEIKLSANIAGTKLYEMNDKSEAVFGKGGNGKYPTLSVPAGFETQVADNKITTAEGYECIFVKSSNDGENVNFNLYPEVMLGYKIKSSVTLYSNFVYNIYIPTNDFVSAVRIDGTSLADTDYAFESVTLDGVDYIKISVPLAAKESLRDIAIKVTLISGDTEVDATWTVNVFKYAKQVLAGNHSDEEKALIKDMLSYAKSAYAYFENTASAEDKISEIESLLGENYDTENAPDMSKPAYSPEANRGFKSATVKLGDTPSFIFYLADGFDADDFVFTAGGRVAEAKEGSNGNERYLEVATFAYAMTADISYTVVVDGVSYTESFNIYAYYEYVLREHANDTALRSVVERLAAYAESAGAYKAYVVNNK